MSGQVQIYPDNGFFFLVERWSWNIKKILQDKTRLERDRQPELDGEDQIHILIMGDPRKPQHILEGKLKSVGQGDEKHGRAPTQQALLVAGQSHGAQHKCH
jgi:hypothetical protein